MDERVSSPHQWLFIRETLRLVVRKFCVESLVARYRTGFEELCEVFQELHLILFVLNILMLNL